MPRLWFALALAVNVAMVAYFHDRYWYPTDDGFYANIAERLLTGETLGRDIQDIHPGYIHAVNAAAMRLFEVDLVSMRYPLAVATVLQGLLVFGLFRKQSPLVAACASVAATALGAIQFFNPTPNWYSLVLAIAVGCWLTWTPRAHPARLFGAGVLVGVLTMFRQLSGVWAVMGVFAIVLADTASPRARTTPRVARALLLIMLSASLWYLSVSPGTEAGGILLMAFWPLAVLVVLLRRVQASDAQTVTIMAHIAAGAASAALPFAIYHVSHGSVDMLFRDTVLAGFNETQMPFFGSGWYALLPIVALYQTLTSFDPVKVLNGLYWALLPCLSLLNGALLLWKAKRGELADAGAIPVVAAFYAMVSLYLEGPLYLYYSASLSLCGVLWQLRRRWLSQPAPVVAILLSLTGTAVAFHAGQPRGRTPLQILEGRRLATFSSPVSRLPRVQLRIDAHDQEGYARVLDFIERESAPADTILALPNDAELYFMSGRRNPFRFYNSALGVQTEEQLSAVVAVIEAHPPKLVLFRSDDKYNTTFSRRIMEKVRASYVALGSIEGLDVYASNRLQTEDGAPR